MLLYHREVQLAASSRCTRDTTAEDTWDPEDPDPDPDDASGEPDESVGSDESDASSAPREASW